MVIDKFSQLINPERSIPNKIVKITGITDEMVWDKPTIQEVLPKFKEFIEDSVLVAHNASFDISFIKESFQEGNKLNNPYLILRTI